MALIGSSGSGKSSVLAHALLGGVGRFAPIAVPLSVTTNDSLSPALVADRLIREVAEAAHLARAVSDSEREATHAGRAAERPVRSGRNITASLKWLGVELALDLQRQTEVDVRVSAEEKMEVVDQVLGRISREGLAPVIVFDDTGRWLPGVGYEDPTRNVEAFFGRVVRWIGDLGFAVVVAVHAAYFTDVAPRAQLLDALDTPIDVPRLPDETALQAVLKRRLAHACVDSDYAAATLQDVFDDDAVAALYGRYVDDHLTVRGVVKPAHLAMIEAADAGLSRISAAAVNAALASERP